MLTTADIKYLIDVEHQTDLDSDPWGHTMGLLGDVSDYLLARGLGVPWEGLRYTPAPAHRARPEEAISDSNSIAELFDEEQTSAEVIKAFGWYLIGYADCLERAGESY